MLREQHAPGDTQLPPAAVQVAPSPKGLMAKYKEGLKIVSDFLDPDGDQREQRKRCNSLSIVLKELDRKQHEIERQLREEMDETSRKRLEKRLGIVHAQQKKGLKVLDSLK